MRPRFVSSLVISVVAVSACVHAPPASSLPPPKVTAVATAVPLPPLPVVTRSEGSREGSAVLLAAVDTRLLAYVADEDDACVRVLDVESQSEISTLPLHGAPAQLVMLRDHRLVVALRDRNEIDVLSGVGTPHDPLTIAER